MEHTPIDADSRLHISETLSIPLAELSFRYSRAGGPGGQSVNRSASRVELIFDVAGSPSLSESQRARILGKVAGQIDTSGVLHLVASSERSQLRNRQDVVERFRLLLANALRQPRHRRPTRPSAASRERRLQRKRRRSDIKKTRRSLPDRD